MPFPRRSKTNSASNPEVRKIVKGWIQTVSRDTLVVSAVDSRIIEFVLDAKTVQPAGLKSGDFIEIEAWPDDQGRMHGLEIRRATPPKDASPPQAPKPAAEAPQPDAEPAEPSRTVVKRAEVNDDVPRLRRGIPPARKTSEKADAEVTPDSPTREVARSDAPARYEAPAKQAQTNPEMELLNRARREAAGFLSTLPNYLCKQFTTRYEGTSRPENWRARDVVSAELVFEDGKERYEKLAINGKPVKGNIEDSGAWSTGEFGTVLRDLLSPETDGAFRFAGYNNVQRQSAAQYNFTVERANSHWKIGVPGQYIFPSYKGSIWVSKESARVLRIEMQATRIPKEFPVDTTELALDYDWITLETQRYLLPLRGEVLSCQRGTNDCQKNTIEFRNYRKFGAKSDIIFK